MIDFHAATYDFLKRRIHEAEEKVERQKKALKDAEQELNSIKKKYIEFINSRVTKDNELEIVRKALDNEQF